MSTPHTQYARSREAQLAYQVIGSGSRDIVLAFDWGSPPSEVLVTRTVRDLVAGSGIRFEERGEHELKGVPDRWALYAATG